MCSTISYISLYSPQHSETIQLHWTPAIRPHLWQHISPQGPNHWLRAPSIHGTFGQGIFGAADRTQSSEAPTLHTSDVSKTTQDLNFHKNKRRIFRSLKVVHKKGMGNTLFNHLNWKLNDIIWYIYIYMYYTYSIHIFKSSCCKMSGVSTVSTVNLVSSPFPNRTHCR